MAKLHAAARNALPDSAFAGPGRSFPIEDKNHAKAALIDVGRAKGLSSGQKAIIRSRAKGMLDGVKK